MTKRFSQILKPNQLCMLCAFVIVTAGNVFGNFYLQGGASHWPGYEPPRSILSDIPFLSRETDNLDRRSEIWIGAGYHVNGEWSFEAFFSKLPSTEVEAELFTFFPGRPTFPGPIFPDSVSISITTETTIFGVGACYDFYVNDRLSLIGKAGIAHTKQDSDVDLSFPNFRIPPIYLEDDDYFDDWFDDDFYFDDDGLFGDDDSVLDMYFAVGVRFPIQETKASVTATYQFVNTPDNNESGLFLGVRWDM